MYGMYKEWNWNMQREGRTACVQIQFKRKQKFLV